MVEAYMIQTEDKAAVKEYLGLLDKIGMDRKKSAATYAFQEIECTRYYLNTVFEEQGYIRDRIWKLKDGTGKGHAVLAHALAGKKLDAAGESFARVDALVENGVKTAMARFRNGSDNALERPFPLIATEKELKNIIDCLAGAFAAFDIGIGRIEETEGMACKDGHYRNAADGTLWEGGTGEQAWLDVLWPMRSLEKLIISAQDTVHDAAWRVDNLRPKASSMIKKHVLAPGLQWELEKERERIAAVMSGRSPKRTVYVWERERLGEQKDALRVAENAGPPKEKDGYGQEKGGGKTSLRKRLELAGEKSHRIYGNASPQKQESRAGEMQI